MTLNFNHTSWTRDWRVFFLNLRLAFSSECSGALTCDCHSLADPALTLPPPTSSACCEDVQKQIKHTKAKLIEQQLPNSVYGSV